MTESVLPALFFLTVLLLNIEYPIIGTLFIAAPLLVAIGKYIGSIKRSRTSCAQCAFYNPARDRCMYSDTGDCVEKCKSFRLKTDGGK